MAWLSMISPLYALSGFFVGALVGMTGVGGGSLMTPLLILLFGVHPATAVGTDLLYAAATKTVGTLMHKARHTVEWPIALRLAAGSVPATLATVWALHRGAVQSAGGSSPRALALVLAVALLLTAITLVLRPWLLARVAHRATAISPGLVTLLTVLSGVVLGVVVTLTSVGAGALGMTALVMLYPRVPVVRLVGADIAHAVPLTLIAGAGHWWLGEVNFQILLSLLAGSLPGILLGSYVASRIPGGMLRGVLAATLTVAAWQLVK